MPSIKILPPQIVEKIAAGEVVERPASVVKELIENSLDAKASRIKIKIRDGGRRLIEVVDNGCGMDKTDAQLAFEHHATSKISDFFDIINLSTYGFRGEALSSIASVAKVTMITATAESYVGTKIVIWGGEVKEVEEISTPSGTTVRVENIFYNLPARRKFLSSFSREAFYIKRVVTGLSLSCNEVFWELQEDGEVTLTLYPVSLQEDRITQIFSEKIKDCLIPFSANVSDLSIKGYITTPQFASGNKSNFFFYVNNRWIKDPLLSKIVEDVISGIFPPRKFPFLIAFFNITPVDVDVNVHPRKEEVKILKKAQLVTLFREVLKKAIVKMESKVTSVSLRIAPGEIFNKLRKEKEVEILPFSWKRVSSTPKNSLSALSVNQVSILPLQKNWEATEKSLFSPDLQREFEVMGQFAKTFILAKRGEEELIIVDQHIAEERIYYEYFIKRDSSSPLQQLLIPELITLTQEEEALVKDSLQLFKEIGFHLEPFGSGKFILRAIPSQLRTVNWQKEFSSLLQELFSFPATVTRDRYKEKLCAALSCRVAVKAGVTLTIDEMHKLLEKLWKCENRNFCPHGRPIFLKFTQKELYKLFSR